MVLELGLKENQGDHPNAGTIDRSKKKICKGFPHSGFFPGLGPIMMSLCVCILSSTIPFIFRCINDDGGVVSFYVIAYVDA